MPREDYQTSTVDGAAAFERGRAASYGPWDWDDRPTAADFYEEPDPEDGDTVQSFGKVTHHTARRDHADGKVKAGQRYARVTYGGYVVGGGRWLTSYKVVLEEGQKLPGWHYNNAFERGVLRDEEW
jgi:hypothetical protein